MFQAHSSLFRAAVIARSFIVGFRYFRQPSNVQAQMLNTMLGNIQQEMFNEQVHTPIFRTNNIYATLSSMLDAETAKETAAKILLLASPLFLKSAKVREALGITDVDVAKQEIIAEVNRHIALNENDPRIDTAAVFDAYTGNTAFAEALGTAPMDEDQLPMKDCVPFFPMDLPGSWVEELDKIRKAQWAQYNQPQMFSLPEPPSVIEVPAEFFIDIPEADLDA